MLSSEEQVDLIVWQAGEIERLKKENADLKKKLSIPKKTSKNSSIPPSKAFKKNQSKPGQAKRVFHGKGGRELSISPDETMDFKPTTCTKCQNSLSNGHKLEASYDKLFLPEIKIKTVRVNIFSAKCSDCKEVNRVELPQEYADRSLCSSEIKSLISYLHYENYVSFERLSKYFSDVHQVNLSEGLISSILKNALECFGSLAQSIQAELVKSQVVCSDETSARVKGKTYWQWVFQNEQACLHVIDPSRASRVKHEIFGEEQPEVWVSDAYSAQKMGLKNKWQVCLSHQIRSCNFAIESGDVNFSSKMKALFQEAIQAQHLNRSEKRLKKKEYIKRLDAYLQTGTHHLEGKKLHKRFENLKANLFLFLDYDNVPPTNNSSEQALRPSVIFRKVTNGFRSEWGKDLFAALRTVLDTAKRKKQNTFQVLNQVFSQQPTLCLPG